MTNSLKYGEKDNWVLFMLLLLCFHSTALSSHTQSCSQNDLKAMRDFSKGLESKQLLQWSNASYCCSWIGVKCEHLPKFPVKRVARLELGGMELEGSLSKSLGSLDQLKFLDLSSNYLGGPLPEELFILRRLETLDLSNNQFNGTVPTIIGLPSIKIFNLADNKLDAHQPIFGESAKLMKFCIEGNHFSGHVNAVICNRNTGLQVLDFSSNRFEGHLPTGLGNCRSLVHFFLNTNSFTGSLPNDLFSLPYLKQLHLHKNRISGMLDERIGRLSNLTHLDDSS